MKLKKLKMVGVCICVAVTTVVAQANEVLLTSNEPTQIIYRVVHQNSKGQPVFEPPQSMAINKNEAISIDLNNFDLAGIMILSVDGHDLPASANQFNQPNQCSLTTDRTKTRGQLAISLSAHEISCRYSGGVFG